MSADAPSELQTWQKCWCWQYGRCLVDCPTADVPPPIPFVTATWRPAALALMKAAKP